MEMQIALSAVATTTGAWASGVSPLVTAIVSVCVGAVLGFGGSYLLGRQQRGWQQEQSRFERELALVKGLDEALVDAERRILERESPPDGASRWEFALEAWEQAWVRLSPFLANHEIHDRYEAVGRILAELVTYDGAARPAFQRNAAMRATLNARQAIAYFGREELLPPRCFPGPDELTRLLGEGDPDPFDRNAPFAKWLKDHPAAPWRIEKSLATNEDVPGS
ncbi:MAG: hypothetical protein JSU06_19265 [Actinobacteria bacterium]|nr:hypothetical protein [Actinomycetota bacterium]